MKRQLVLALVIAGAKARYCSYMLILGCALTISCGGNIDNEDEITFEQPTETITPVSGIAEAVGVWGKSGDDVTMPPEFEEIFLIELDADGNYSEYEVYSDDNPLGYCVVPFENLAVISANDDGGFTGRDVFGGEYSVDIARAGSRLIWRTVDAVDVMEPNPFIFSPDLPLCIDLSNISERDQAVTDLSSVTGVWNEGFEGDYTVIDASGTVSGYSESEEDGATCFVRYVDQLQKLEVIGGDTIRTQTDEGQGYARLFLRPESTVSSERLTIAGRFDTRRFDRSTVSISDLSPLCLSDREQLIAESSPVNEPSSLFGEVMVAPIFLFEYLSDPELFKPYRTFAFFDPSGDVFIYEFASSADRLGEDCYSRQFISSIQHLGSNRFTFTDIFAVTTEKLLYFQDNPVDGGRNLAVLGTVFSDVEEIYRPSNLAASDLVPLCPE